jgi:hypothetical protein
MPNNKKEQGQALIAIVVPNEKAKNTLLRVVHPTGTEFPIFGTSRFFDRRAIQVL